MSSPFPQLLGRGLRFAITRLQAKSRSSRRQRFSAVASAIEVVEERRVLSAFTVLNLNDSGQGSLRDAIAAANANPGADLIHFQRRLGGTIHLTTGQMEITDALTIRGNGARRLTISGNETSRIFQMEGTETDVEIKDLTIANGRHTMKDDIGIILTRGGGILNDGGNLTLSRVTMRNNKAIDINDPVVSSDVVGGGAVANTGNGRLTATHCRFIGNVVSGGLRYAFGGAIANVSDSIAVINNSVFVRNEAMGGSTSYGGAIGNFGSSQLTVSGSTFRSNTARALDSLTASAQEAFGGAIATRPGTVVSSGSTTTIDRSLFIGNRALGGAAGDGEAGGDAGGGALYSVASTLTVGRSRFLRNHVVGGKGDVAGGNAWGGAIEATAVSSTDLPLTHINTSLFSGNRVLGGAAGGQNGTAAGGALFNSFGQMDVSQTRILNNGARARNGGSALGGGIFNGESFNGISAVLNINDSSVIRNFAHGGSGGNGHGGGIYNGNQVAGANPVATMIQTRIVANRATGGPTGQGIGGGIYTVGTFNFTGGLPRGNHASTRDKDIFGILTPV
ncbi:MAG: hypothetical protein P8K08_09690 [Fuerstiella sp.]|nr:hypothetical protein [Fuerstiella sp.]